MQLSSQTTKRIQQIELNILKEFIRICERENLRYYLIGGTLIGAVRHKGFIPWDDDIDVGMPRTDYEKFLKIAPNLLQRKYFLQTYHSNKQIPWPFAKLRDKETIYKEQAFSKMDICHGVWIDVFPLDFSKLITYPFIGFVLHLLLIRSTCRFVEVNPALKHRIAQKVSYLYCPSWKKSVQWRDKLAHLYKKDTGIIGNLSGRYGRREIVPSSWFKEPVWLEFEGLKVAAPTKYHEYLTHVYGDYMKLPPKEKRVNEHSVTEINFDITTGEAK